MPIEIIDTPQPVQRFLPRLGDVHTIIRYITTNVRNDKCIKPVEAKAIAAAGKKLGIVYETWGDFAHAGRGGISGVDGMRDGKFARAYLPTIGAPRGACVYFAVDVDASTANINRSVLPYFKAISEQFADGYYRVGMYGPGAAIQAVIDAGYCELGWLANAKGWSGYKAFLPHAAIVQQLQRKIAGGLDVDPDVAQIDDWGQFTPFEEDASLLPDGPVAQNEGSRLGQGDDGFGTNYGSVTAIAGAAGSLGLFERAKSMFKSKTAWLTGGLGTTGAGAAVSADPETLSLLERLAHSPAFWLSLLCIVLAGVIIYYRWKDHGRGAV